FALAGDGADLATAIAIENLRVKHAFKQPAVFRTQHLCRGNDRLETEVQLAITNDVGKKHRGFCISHHEGRLIAPEGRNENIEIGFADVRRVQLDASIEEMLAQGVPKPLHGHDVDPRTPEVRTPITGAKTSPTVGPIGPSDTGIKAFAIDPELNRASRGTT